MVQKGHRSQAPRNFPQPNVSMFKADIPSPPISSLPRLRPLFNLEITTAKVVTTSTIIIALLVCLVLVVINRIGNEHAADETSANTQRCAARHAHAGAALLRLLLMTTTKPTKPAAVLLRVASVPRLGVAPVPLLRRIASVSLLRRVTSVALLLRVSLLAIAARLVSAAAHEPAEAAKATAAAAVAAAARLLTTEQLAQETLALLGDVVRPRRKLVRIGRTALWGRAGIGGRSAGSTGAGGEGTERAACSGVLLGLKLAGESSVLVLVCRRGTAMATRAGVIVWIDLGVRRRWLVIAGRIERRRAGRCTIVVRRARGLGRLVPLRFLCVCVDVEPFLVLIVPARDPSLGYLGRGRSLGSLKVGHDVEPLGNKAAIGYTPLIFGCVKWEVLVGALP